jgi:hypothetical protein
MQRAALFDVRMERDRLQSQLTEVSEQRDDLEADLWPPADSAQHHDCSPRQH